MFPIIIQIVFKSFKLALKYVFFISLSSNPCILTSFSIYFAMSAVLLSCSHIKRLLFCISVSLNHSFQRFQRFQRF
ncbi:hypothetical protein EMPG_09584 [Blastomyces silverae]|uniref:Uncharacterized protein n=1 Tax=Blastomyces silverae TaxID=2060906 RepID=A0A0H1BSN5_9EURO|nr:hypothetical protein EMPG_09584 [Blastomyces silverae]